MFRITLRGINDVEAVRNYFVVETPHVGFYLKTLQIEFYATDDCTYYIDFKEDNNQFLAGASSSDDEIAKIEKIYKTMNNLRFTLMRDGYLDLSDFGAKIRD